MRWTIFVLAVFLSGCVAHYDARYQSPPPLQATSMAQVNAMVGAQQPVPYKVGFMAGCDSGRVSAGNGSFIFKKDAPRFDSDSVYQQGWTDGYNRCYAEGAVVAGSSSVTTTYGWGYYPGTFHSGIYYPYGGYYSYYEPGYSIWLGTYGHHDHYVYNDYHYYTPWYGGHKHRGGHSYRGRSYSGGGGLKSYINPGSGHYSGGGGGLNSHINRGGNYFSGGDGSRVQKHRSGKGHGNKSWKGQGHGHGNKGKGGGNKGRGRGNKGWRH